MSSNNLQDPALQGYKIQGIYYLNKRTHRIQQNVGGACPLLALSNTLFLNHQIHYNKGGRRIKFQELTDCLTQHLENMLNNSDSGPSTKVKTELRVDKNISNSFDISSNFSKLYEDDSHDDSDDMDIPINIGMDGMDDIDTIDNNIVEDNSKDKSIGSVEEKEISKETCDKQKEKEMDLKIKQIEECVSLFPKLEEGLDINIKFSNACDFEENPGYRMFSHYGFKLFHGWVVNPKTESELYKLVGNKSYDETIDYLVSDPDKDATDEEKKELEDNKNLIRKFFSESATQLTSYGLEKLYELMGQLGEDILAIFFRNNHFSTIVKHGDILYEFVTDEGIVDADPQITWQTLSQISGDEEFVNNKFQPIHTNISQYTQIAQYNRMKLAADNSNGNEEKKEEKKDAIFNENDDKLIGILNTALNFIDSESFEKLNKISDEFDNLDPLISHGLTQRINDTFDNYMCRDFIFGINNISINDCNVRIRMFRLSDGLSIYNLINNCDSITNKSIDWMHLDNKYAIILEEEQPSNELEIKEQESDVLCSKERERYGVNKIIQNKNIKIIGCIIYEWIKFNFWDWRETDWEDYDIESVYNVSSMNNNQRYNKQRLLRESGVRTDYFIHIDQICVHNKYQTHALDNILLRGLLYAFESGTKFGGLVPTINTNLVKCFTNNGFTITRLEQSYGNDTKYKMTTQSQFTISNYKQWVYNCNYKPIKTKTITSKTHMQLDGSNNMIETEIFDDSIPPLIDENNNNIGMDISDDACDGYSDDDRHQQSHDIDTHEEEDDDDDIHRIHCGDGIDGIDAQQQSLISHQHQLGQQSVDNIVGMGGVSDLFGYHSGHGGNIGGSVGHGQGGQIVGDSFVFNALNKVGLRKYNHIFIEFNINKDALLHLEPSVVEFMMNDANDRKIFLQWLDKYKKDIEKSKEKNKPTKPPKQQSMNVKTQQEYTDQSMKQMK